MKRVSDAQVKKVMEEMNKHGAVGRAAMKADVDRKTAGKYIKAGLLPSEFESQRDWRTRLDPFVEHWPELEQMLRDAPGLESKTLFEVLTEKYPGQYEPGQLRTLQRRVKAWKALQGPERNVVLGQAHRPGEAMQTDFTDADELGVTIAGEPYAHKLCVSVLPYSDWCWATICLSESMIAIRKGVQRTLFQLGRVPMWHQTDNSTAATHRLPGAKGGPALAEGTTKRPFNDEYLALMRHFGMTPRTTEVGEKQQNGDVEAANGALKRKLAQALLVRGSSDFTDVESWQSFIDDALRKANKARGSRVAEDMEAMRELNAQKLPDFKEEHVVVNQRSTIYVQRNTYSVPSRLIGETVRVRLYEELLEVYYDERLQLRCERLRGRSHRRIEYRHMIWSLVRKPGAFARYVYRDEMFPSLVFRRAYDSIQETRAGTRGDLEYLRILHFAASTVEADVESAVELLLGEGKALTVDGVKALVCPERPSSVPAMQPLVVDLNVYDALLQEVAQ